MNRKKSTFKTSVTPKMKAHEKRWYLNFYKADDGALLASPSKVHPTKKHVIVVFMTILSMKPMVRWVRLISYR